MVKIAQGSKVCKSCGEVYDLSSFYVQGRYTKKNGISLYRRNVCKWCYGKKDRLLIKKHILSGKDIAKNKQLRRDRFLAKWRDIYGW